MKLLIPDKFVGLKRYYATSLLFIYLFSTTEVYQFVKIPELLQHYFEHSKTNGDLNFGQFLQMHYDSGNVKDENHDENKKLPFKTHEHNFSLISAFYNAFNENPTIAPLIQSELRQLIPLDDQFLLTPSCLSIWQPPRAS